MRNNETIGAAVEAAESRHETCSTCKYWKPYYEVMVCKLYGDSHDCGGYESCSRWEAAEENSIVQS